MLFFKKFSDRKPFMTVNDTRNDLERLLDAFQNGAIEAEAFAERLLPLSVFMPVRDEKRQIAGFQTSTKAEPLILESDEGARVLVLFTAPERAKAFTNRYPGYGGGLLVEFSWVLQRMAADVGISLNPDGEPGFDFEPDMIAMLASLLPETDRA